MDEHGPTWWEGYWAHSAGWGLGTGHTEAYCRGWRYRAELMRER